MAEAEWGAGRLRKPESPDIARVALMSRIEFSPEKRRRELGKLTQLFSSRGWKADSKYFERLIDNGWTAGRISGEDRLLASNEWYNKQLGTTVELRVGEIKDFSPGGISYERGEGKWVLLMDLAKPQFDFRRFEKFEDGYLLHEHTHEIQGRLMGLDTIEMLGKTYPAGEQRRYLSNLGFRDWERDFSMPPVFFTEEQDKKLNVIRDKKEIARHARDIHADATALRNGYMHVKVEGMEAELGITPLTKTLLEYVFETLNYTPQNLEAVYDEGLFNARENVPAIARFRAVSGGLLNRIEGLPQADKDAMVKCLDKVASIVRRANVEGYTVADLKGDTIEERIRDMSSKFDWYAEKYFDVGHREAYEVLVDTYTKHLLYCMDRSKALKEVGAETLVKALNDEKDPKMRVRAAEYLGELGEVPSLIARRGKENHPLVSRVMLNSILDSAQAEVVGSGGWDSINYLASSGDVEVKRRLARLLSFSTPGNYERALDCASAVVSSEEDDVVRWRCARAVGIVGGANHEKALNVLEVLGKSENFFTRLYTVGALRELRLYDDKKWRDIIENMEYDPRIGREIAHTLDSVYPYSHHKEWIEEVLRRVLKAGERRLGGPCVDVDRYYRRLEEGAVESVRTTLDFCKGYGAEAQDILSKTPKQRFGMLRGLIGNNDVSGVRQFANSLRRVCLDIPDESVEHAKIMLNSASQYPLELQGEVVGLIVNALGILGTLMRSTPEFSFNVAVEYVRGLGELEFKDGYNQTYNAWGNATREYGVHTIKGIVDDRPDIALKMAVPLLDDESKEVRGFAVDIIGDTAVYDPEGCLMPLERALAKDGINRHTSDALWKICEFRPEAMNLVKKILKPDEETACQLLAQEFGRHTDKPVAKDDALELLSSMLRGGSSANRYAFRILKHMMSEDSAKGPEQQFNEKLRRLVDLEPGLVSLAHSRLMKAGTQTRLDE